MSADRDPLDDAIDAFRAASAPEPVRDLAAEDDATRRVVAWMAAALAAQQPATVAPPSEILHRRRAATPRWRVLPGRPALAAAALLLVLLGAALWLSVRNERRAEAPVAAGPGVSEPVVEAPVAPAPVAQAPVAPRPAAPGPVEPVTAEARPAPGLVAVSEDHLELRSGPVRLLLFTNNEQKPPEDPR